MRKSQSCPTLCGIYQKKGVSISLVPNAYNMDLSPTPISLEQITATEHVIERKMPQGFSQVLTDVTKHFQYQAMLRAPLHHIDMCLVENGKKIEDIFTNGNKTEQDYNLATCVVSPVDYEEMPHEPLYEALKAPKDSGMEIDGSRYGRRNRRNSASL